MKYGELKAAHNALRPWHARMAITVRSFEEVAGTLETFRAQREEARRMLSSLPPKLARMEAEREPGSSEGELPSAAVETYNRALQESQKEPANWLLVYVLLTDVSERLAQIENPAMRTPYRPARDSAGKLDPPGPGALVPAGSAEATIRRGLEVGIRVEVETRAEAGLVRTTEPRVSYTGGFEVLA